MSNPYSYNILQPCPISFTYHKGSKTIQTKQNNNTIIPFPVLISLQSQITNNKQHKVFEIDSQKENTKKHNANILQAHLN